MCICGSSFVRSFPLTALAACRTLSTRWLAADCGLARAAENRARAVSTHRAAFGAAASIVPPASLGRRGGLACNCLAASGPQHLRRGTGAAAGKAGRAAGAVRGEAALATPLTVPRPGRAAATAARAAAISAAPSLRASEE